MKENSVLHVLMYLFQTHRQEHEALHEDDSLVEQLESAGFILPTINRAIGWLATLAKDNDIVEIAAPQSDSFRYFTTYERDLLGEECIMFILALEHHNILNPTTREMVIHQAIELQDEGIDLNLIKWVALMVLFNQPDQEEALSSMELLVLDNPFGGIH